MEKLGRFHSGCIRQRYPARGHSVQDRLHIGMPNRTVTVKTGWRLERPASLRYGQGRATENLRLAAETLLTLRCQQGSVILLS
jgi:hypothetical protein